MGCRQDDKGFTLLELVAALAIFSVLALMSTQLLSAGLTSTARISVADDADSDLMAAAAVLRRDLERLAPVTAASDGGPGFRVLDAGAGLALVILEGDEAQLRRVDWRLDPSERQFARYSRAVNPTAPGVVTAAFSGVEGLELRALSDHGAWREAAAWRAGGPADLPRAVEVALTLVGIGDLRILVAR